MRRVLTGLLLVALQACATLAEPEPLPGWNDTATRAALVDFILDVSTPGHPDFVPQAERIAVFDNDGTLWAEKPAYFQLLFALDRIRALAAEHPEWRDQQPYKAAIEGDMATLARSGVPGLLEIVTASHAGMTAAEFEAAASQWLSEARHPQTARPYTGMVYQPMLELLRFLRERGFKVFIVSGGGVDFLRTLSEDVYGIPRENVVGSSIALEYRSDPPRIERLPEMDFIDDKAGKPVGIQRHIGRRPIAAFGNSDGDFQMLEWTTAGPGRRLGVLLHHTDAGREWAYDRDSHVGKLDRGLDEADGRGWVLIDMRNDWNVVFPPAE